MRLASVFTDHMVLQAGKPIKIFGQGAGTLLVQFLNMKKEYTITEEEWCVSFPEAAYGGPYEMHFNLNGQEVVLRDVHVGEVWLACGQSNMELPLFRTEYALEEAAHSENDQIRFFTVPRRTRKDVPIYGWHAEKATGEDKPWQVCNEESALHFSAIGYYVAKELQQKLGVTIGVISCNWGGTPIETYIKREYFETSECLRPELEKYQKMLAELDWDAYEEAYRQSMLALENYCRSIDYDEVEEVREKGVRACIGEPKGTVPQMPDGPYTSKTAGCLYDSMISRIAPFGVQGVLWYQGESNHCDYYLDKYLVFMQCMRDTFENQDLHFCAAELAGYGYCNDPGSLRQNADNRFIYGNNIALTREQQQRATEVGRNNYLATCMELGDYSDIHPIQKKPLAHRMTLKLLKYVYGFDIYADHPTFRSVEFKEGKAYIQLDHADGLYSRVLWAVKMYVADESHELKRAQIKIEDDMLILSCPAVPNPTVVHYAFDSYYLGYHIYNKAGLPLAPFRTDGPERK